MNIYENTIVGYVNLLLEVRLRDVEKVVCAVHGCGRVGGTAVVRQPLFVRGSSWEIFRTLEAHMLTEVCCAGYLERVREVSNLDSHCGGRLIRQRITD